MHAEFIVNQEDILSKEHTPGITGYVRYYNDGYTLIPSLESIRGIFDEIVIVHQPTEGIHRERLNMVISGSVESLKNEKIRAFEYPVTPWVHGSPGKKPTEKVFTLANYYNYGMSKIHTSKFMKIDTDQIYFPSNLKMMLACNRIPHVITYPYGINLFMDDNGNHLSPQKSPLNGLYGDTLPTDFSIKPWFKQTHIWEQLQTTVVKTIRFDRPCWLHVTQPRRPNHHGKNLGRPCRTEHWNLVDKNEMAYALEEATKAIIESKHR